MTFRSTDTQKSSRIELINKGKVLIIQWAFSSSGKLKLQFVSGRLKAADYMKMQNDLSLA